MPPIFTVIASAPVVPGAVYVAVHTPLVQVTAPTVPRPTVVVIAKSAGAAVRTTLLNASRTVTVTVAVPFVAIVVALMATVVLAALGAAAITTRLRRITIRPAESAGVVMPVRNPVSVYDPAKFDGVQLTVARPLASA